MKPFPFTCTQSYGRGGTEVRELRRPSKTWNRTKEKRWSGFPKCLYLHSSIKITTCFNATVKWEFSDDGAAVATGWIYTSCRNSLRSRCDVHSPRLREDVSVDVHHQVASCCVLHNKTYMFWSLEAGKQVDQERVVRHVHNLKDAFLAH